MSAGAGCKNWNDFSDRAELFLKSQMSKDTEIRSTEGQMVFKYETISIFQPD